MNQPVSPEKVLKWYRLFLIVSVLLNLLIAVGIQFLPNEFALVPDAPPLAIGLFKSGLLWIGLFLAAVNAVFLMLPRTTWAYILHLTNLSINATTCIWTPICAYLITQFRSAEMQTYFGFKLSPQTGDQPENR